MVNIVSIIAFVIAVAEVVVVPEEVTTLGTVE
jgi:hypothetical protein